MRALKASRQVPVVRSKTLAPIADISRAIAVLRGQKILLDESLAALYGVETKVLIQAIKRNATRFPADFMFQLTNPEWAALRSQIVTSRAPGHGGRRYPPYAFTEQGVAMLSSNTALARKLDELERKYKHHDEAIASILTAIRELMQPLAIKRRGIGFTADID